jgi:hypothetical protein
VPFFPQLYPQMTWVEDAPQQPATSAAPGAAGGESAARSGGGRGRAQGVAAAGAWTAVPPYWYLLWLLCCMYSAMAFICIGAGIVCTGFEDAPAYPHYADGCLVAVILMSLQHRRLRTHLAFLLCDTRLCNAGHWFQPCMWLCADTYGILLLTECSPVPGS